MQRSAATPVLGSILLASVCTIALALGADYLADHPISGNDQWPKGLKKLVNGPGRAGGFFVNADDYVYFCGDAKAFNAFLKQYGEIEDAGHRLVLHPGQGLEKRPWGKKDAKPIDWFVQITNRAWRDIGRKNKNEPKGYDVTVHLWVGGSVGLEDLDVPLNVDVASSGEIERFVATHEAKQSLVAKEAGKQTPPAAAPSSKTE